MDCLSWNVRGAANRATRFHLKDLLRFHKPLVFVLLETKVSGPNAQKIADSFKGWNCVRSEAQGRSGGIWVFWRSLEVQIRVIQVHHQFVHCEITQNGKFLCLSSFIYASPCLSDRNTLWDNLILLSNNINVPWFLIGDFNDIGSLDDQRGGSQRYNKRSINHKAQMDDCGLIDIGFSGARFTWRCRFLSVRLDKAYGNVHSRTSFPEASVINLPYRHSDHAPILFKMNSLVGQKALRPFRYLMVWEDYRDFKNVVRHAWANLTSPVLAATVFKSNVTKWNREVFGNIFSRKHMILKRLAGVQRAISEGCNDYLFLLERSLQNELIAVLRQEELLWFQKSRKQWLTEGDRNTKYFHLSTIIRRKQNKIEAIQLNNGNWIYDLNNIRSHAFNFYKNLFLEDQPRSFVSCNTTISFPHLSDCESNDIFRPVSVEDFRQTLFDMSPNKAPGIDGLPAAFYQRHWGIVKDSLCSFVLNCLSGIEDIASVNQTLLVLIPKIANPVSFMQFRPISLCNVMYKLITKIIANRLQLLLPKIIAPTQCSFVPGRQIIDNIVMAQEVIHSMRRKKGKQGYVAIKIDLEKAYDRLNWDFVAESMKHANIPVFWQNIVNKCLSTNSMQVLINGEMTDDFIPSRGVRQGDLISPYIFVLCMARLDHLLKDVVDSNKLKPIKLVRDGPNISHLFFADDIMIFLEADVSQILQFMEIMDLFCASYSQKINLQKSKLCVSKNVSDSLARSLSDACNIPLTNCLGKYLGVPLLHDRVKLSTFAETVNRMQSKLSSWKANSLSLAGRATLVQSVTSASPNHIMQTNMLPSGVLNKMEKMNRNFIWGNKDQKQKIHLVPWETICKPKDLGGIGIRQARDNNKVLLMKLLWRI
ncbi:LINE-1 retrotransposable element ORF2 protein [Euphorbia peplus]|nr:LINE-1 retrotransposable element ORF2 protein [Euphorbia peplus]